MAFPSMTLPTAWIAKERRCDPLAAGRTGVGQPRIGHLRWKFAVIADTATRAQPRAGTLLLSG
jgi:hypothetical protein